MESNNSLHTGTASGTLLSIMPTIASEDILKTIVLAIIGAIISFGVSIVLKWITKSKTK